MTSIWIHSFIQRVLAAGLAKPGTHVGCTEQEITEIESVFQLTLPETYKDYLRQMGRDSGDFLFECLLTYPELVEYVRKKADTLLEASTSYQLPKSAFVFIECYGSQFFFFDTADRNDNPPVFRYYEGDQTPVKIAETFTQAMDLALSEQIDDRSDMVRERPYEFFVSSSMPL
jgi:hypothetical protein